MNFMCFRLLSYPKIQPQPGFKWCLVCCKCFCLWWKDRKYVFLACLPNEFVAWQWCPMLDLETWCPRNTIKLCDSETVAIFYFSGLTVAADEVEFWIWISHIFLNDCFNCSYRNFKAISLYPFPDFASIPWFSSDCTWTLLNLSHNPR